MYFRSFRKKLQLPSDVSYKYAIDDIYIGTTNTFITLYPYMMFWMLKYHLSQLRLTKFRLLHTRPMVQIISLIAHKYPNTLRLDVDNYS